MSKLLETGASGVGGPNLLPTTDGPVAACVSASPGTPAHILIDDNVAEHVPGCNMAFWADRLRAIGGFDPVYRKAGDDVDLCWRLQAEGDFIVYAPAAMVWHHRRATVQAYLKQQRGYGEAEAPPEAQAPGEVPRLPGRPLVDGPHLHARRPRPRGGQAASSTTASSAPGMFQTIYSPPQVWWPLLVLSLEWWLCALSLLLLAPVYNPLRPCCRRASGVATRRSQPAAARCRC